MIRYTIDLRNNKVLAGLMMSVHSVMNILNSVIQLDSIPWYTRYTYTDIATDTPEEEEVSFSNVGLALYLYRVACLAR